MTVLLIGSFLLAQTVFMSWFISRNRPTEEYIVDAVGLPARAEDMATKWYVDEIHHRQAESIDHALKSISEAMFEALDEQEEWMKNRFSNTISRVSSAEDLANDLIDVINSLTDRLEPLEKKVLELENRQLARSYPYAPQPKQAVNSAAHDLSAAKALQAQVEQPVHHDVTRESSMPDTPEHHQSDFETSPEESLAELKGARGEDDPLITDLRALPLDADPDVRSDEALEGIYDIPAITSAYEISGGGGAPTDAERRAADRARRGVRGFPR